MAAKQEKAAADASGAVFAKFERAKRTNVKCNAEELAIRDELRQIERRKVELRTTRKLNRGQRNVWLQDLTEKTVIPYSEAWNLRIAEAIQSAFPPEIREMVYRHLLDDDMWHDYEHHFLAVMSVLDPEISHCCCTKQGHGLPRLPHFLYPQYVGEETAMELIEKIYSSEWFQRQTVYGSLPNLESLLYQDPLGIGFEPAPFVRSINVVCFVDRYRESRQCVRQETCRHNPYQRRYINREEIEPQFDELRGLEKNKDFRSLEITFVQRNIRIDVLEEALEAFTEVYQAFRTAGASVRVEWGYTSHTCGPFLHAHNRNLSKFYTESRHTWKHRMLQFLERIKPCLEPRHVRFIDEPSLGLSDNDFVHRMWDNDETYDITDDEDSDGDVKDSSDEKSDGESDHSSD